MGTMLRSESPRLYSWWWDSHISPKNSKWLQENLTDMDAKVKEMIKLIEEDADSFARRAEMFYEKKPELMKLVEEFYRAYRALAEKYDHAMVELRDAHRIIAKAFPNQIPNMSADSSTPGSSAMELEPQTPEMPHPIYALNDFNKNELCLSSSDLHVAKMNYSNSGTSQRGLKQINQMLVLEEAPPESSKLGDEKAKEYLNFIEAEEEKRCLLDQYSQLSNENQDIETRALSETEVMFAEMHTEKECLILKYKQNFEKLTSLENKISHAQRDAEVLEEQVNKAKNEIQKLKEALLNLEAERDAGHFQNKKCSERISDLEASISQAQENAKEINGRAVNAESESQYLKEEVARLEAEKDATFLRYKQCLEKISSLENIICLAEENEKMLSAQTDRAESEVKDLRQELAELAKEKEVAASRYEQCLNTISKLENEICHARKDAENVKSEVLVDAAKLKAAEKQCVLLGRLNLSLQLELENLAQKMVMKDQELSRRQEEVEKLQISLQDKQSQILQVQAALLTLEKVHSQSQGEQQSLALELRNGRQNVNNLQMCKIGLEEEIKHVKEENHTLNELNLASTISIENLQGEITGLRNMKQKLEEGILLQVDQNNLLEQEIRCLKEEIRDMKLAYEALLTQVKSAGIDPECLGQSLKELQEENLRLNEQSQEDKNEKEALSKKLENMEFFSDRNAALESSLLNSSKELEGSREKIRALQESCWFLQGEKSVLMVEKVGLFCQLHVITESRQKLLEKNTLLDNSLSAANNELETLRLKYKNLEQIQELLSSEKQEHARFVMSSETRLASLQEHVGLLQEKIRLRKKEFEHELDKAINTQVELFILQKFVKDLDEKNLSLLSECWRHVEASKLSDRIIADLESEKFEQQIEAEFLLNEIQKLRMGIYHVFTLLQDDPLEGHGNKMRQDCILLPRIVRNIEDMRTSILENEEEGLQLLVENSVLLALIGQLKLEGSELESEKVTLDQKFCIMKKQIALLQKEKQELLEINRQLIAQVSKKEQEEKFLNSRLMSVQEKLADSQGANFTLREENSKVLEENRFLLKELLGSKRENSMLEEENDVLLREAAFLSYLSLIFQNFGTEKVVEVEVLTEDQNCLKVVNGHLEDEVKVLGEKLEIKERQNLCLNISQAELEKKLHELIIMNDELCYYKFAVDNSLIQKERELSETEEKLQTAEKLAIEMERTIWGLNIEYEESRVINENLEKHVLELSEENNNLNREIEDLLQEKTNLEFELCVELCELHKEIEEREHKEDSLCSELQERGNELKLWEAEGEAFFFNLQTSSIRELLLESKVNELSFICENLRGESALKTVEIGQMKDRASLLEGEICELEARLSAYVPVIASLRNDLASLEHNALFQVIEATAGSQETNCQQLSENPADMILDLQNMRGRVKAIEKTLLDMGKGFSVHKSTTINKPEAATEQTVGSLLTCHQDIHRNKEKIGNRSIDNLRFKMAKSGGSVARNATLLKDITLDRVSGWSGNRSSTRRGGGPEDQMLWEAVGQNCVLNSPHATNTEKQVFGSEEDDSMSNQSESRSEKEMGLELFIGIRKSKQGKDKRKILERLNSDAQKLTGVEMVVRDLKRRMEINKKRKKTKKLDYPTMREQIREVEDALVQLADINGQLLRNFEDRRHVTEAEDARNLRREKEEARRGSEKIGRLQLQVQRIQYLLLKLEDGKKSQGKKKLFKSKTTVLLKNLSPTGSQGKKKLFKSKTTVLLKNLSPTGSHTRRRKKAYFCGWLRPPPNMGNQVTN